MSCYALCLYLLFSIFIFLSIIYYPYRYHISVPMVTIAPRHSIIQGIHGTFGIRTNYRFIIPGENGVKFYGVCCRVHNIHTNTFRYYLGVTVIDAYNISSGLRIWLYKERIFGIGFNNHLRAITRKFYNRLILIYTKYLIAQFGNHNI